MKNKKRFVIMNQNSENYGDEAAANALIGLMRGKYPDCGIDIIYNAKVSLPIEESYITHDMDVSLKNMGVCSIAFLLASGKGVSKASRAFAHVVKEADAVVVSPCGANIGIYKDWRFLVRLLLTVRLGKTPIFHWNTIGKSGNTLFDALAGHVLRKSIVGVREEGSLGYLKTLGVCAELGPDTAFALDAPDVERKPSLVSFVPTQLNGWHPDFTNCDVESIIEEGIVPAVADLARSNDLRIQVLPHLGTEDERAFLKRVCSMLMKESVPVLLRSDVKNSAEYLRALSEGQMTIGMRYHSLVLSAIGGVPFVGIAYEQKMREICRYTSMERYSIDLSECRDDSLALSLALSDCFLRRNVLSADLLSVVREKLRPLVGDLIEKHL